MRHDVVHSRPRLLGRAGLRELSARLDRPPARLLLAFLDLCTDVGEGLVLDGKHAVGVPNRSVDLLVCWFVGWLVGWLVGLLVGWFVGWLGWLVRWNELE